MHVLLFLLKPGLYLLIAAVEIVDPITKVCVRTVCPLQMQLLRSNDAFKESAISHRQQLSNPCHVIIIVIIGR